MKKKFIAVSMVLGALALSSTTLTSCVDDNESASVTAIRDAKAKQLTALANYKDVQAQNEKIVAEAEAAIRNAEAKWLEIQNEVAGLELEKGKAALETEIETAKAKAEAELLTQKVAIEKAKATLLQASDAVDLATQWRINNLIAAADAIMNGGTYILYTGEVYVNQDGTIQSTGYQRQITITPTASINGTGGLTTQLLEDKANKVKAEYDLIDIKLQIAELVRTEKNKLATNQALLAEYQKYSNADKEAAEKAANEANAKLNGLQETLDQATAVDVADAEKINTAYTSVLATEVEKFLADNTQYDANGGDPVVKREAVEAKTVIVTYDDGTYGDATPDYTWTGKYTNTGTTEEPEYQKDETETAKSQIIVDTEKLATKVTEAARSLQVEQAAYDAKVKLQTEGLKDAALVKDAPKFDENDFNNESGLDFTKATYKDLKDVTAAAQKAFDKEATIDNKTALEHAEADEATYIAYFDVDDSALEGAKKTKATIDELNTLLTGDAFKAYTTAYEAYIAAHDANVASHTAVLKAQHNYDVQQDLATTLANVAAGYTDWAKLINSKEQEINENEKNIATFTVKDDNNQEVDEATKQAYIDALDAEIALLEKEISIKQAQYESYMSQVEALINGEETTEVPETPAEEETPAE